MSKKKVSYEEKLAAVRSYQSGEISQAQLSRSLGVGRGTFRGWIQKYETFGCEGLKRNKQNKHYDSTLKEYAVQAYLSREGSLAEMCKKHKIHATAQLRSWIKVYNGHKELPVSRGLGSEIYMTKGKTTTLAERIEIVSFCIEHAKDYTGTIKKYGVSYQQIYSWVRKYEEKGVQSLEDKRGKSKAESELTDTERMKAENRLLQAQNRRLELENAILKKLKELKGCGY